MFFAAIECREHDGHYGAGIVTDQTHYVLIVPEVQGALSHLEIQPPSQTSRLEVVRHYRVVTRVSDNRGE